MILKSRTKPRELLVLEALNSRIKSSHESAENVKRELAKRQKGFLGELRVDHFIKRLANRTTILQDVTLKNGDEIIQMDTIVITDFAIYCIEVKNFQGTILFNTKFRQFIQKNAVEERAFRYPLNQVENHRYQLKLWLHRRRWTNIPINYFIAISKPSTIISVEGDEEEIAKVVTHAEFLPQKIQEQDKQLKRAGQRPLPHRQIGELILQDATSFSRNVLQKFNIKPSDILKGVRCPSCFYIPMKWVKRSWRCYRCQTSSHNAHFATLNDFFLLIKPSISNQEARKFLKINSRHTVYRLLSRANLKYVPNKKEWIEKEEGLIASEIL